MPNFITKLFSSGATKLVEGIGGVLDELITSKDEKLAAELKIKELVAKHEAEMEKEISQMENEFKKKMDLFKGKYP